ncbi:hypothetical protein MNB_ARC-1_1280 [hydrothermal vent metagenome]|uniref:Uncharacterized protein n=1 Tax=hydrothermal vent metagenome TaxID=652676 RepID=A0A3B1EAA4_9ZZZZ
MDSMIIPFIMLLIITVVLILERTYNEKKIVDIYEDKFLQWKKHATLNNKEKNCKQLVGLVFLENEKLTIDVLDKKAEDRLQKKQYTLKMKN